MSRILNERIEQARRSFLHHELVEELNTPQYKAYLMRDPAKGLIDSVRIVFTPSGIVLSGDHTPGRYGNVSCTGYDEHWFGKQQGAYYLAEKFLDTDFHPELALEELKANLAEKEAAEPEDRSWTDEQMEQVRELLTSGPPESAWHMCDALEEIGIRDYYEHLPGMGYDPRELGTLVAINERFAALWQARQKNWLVEAERYRMLIEQSMAKYSEALGWGLTGAQPECWVMLDQAVERLALMNRKLPELASMVHDLHRYYQGKEVASSFNSILQRLGELDVKPHVETQGN